MPSDPTRIGERVATADAALLIAPSGSNPDSEACTDLLAGDDPTAGSVLGVTAAAAPDERLAVWQRAAESQLPRQAAVVDARGRDRSAGDSGSATVSGEPAVSLDVLPADDAAMDVGMAVARRLGAWRDDPGPTRLCLHSVETLADRYARGELLHLLGRLNALCRDDGVAAHHHLDPADVPADLVSDLAPLYDVTARFDGTEWTIEEPTAGQSVGAAGASLADAPGSADVDTALELLSNPIRRALLATLSERTPAGGGSVDVGLDSAVAEVDDAAAAQAADRVPVALRHVHLPKLVDAGVVEFDAEADAIGYRADPVVEALLGSVERLREK